jgi:hypothetical protein
MIGLECIIVNFLDVLEWLVVAGSHLHSALSMQPLECVGYRNGNSG